MTRIRSVRREGTIARVPNLTTDQVEGVAHQMKIRTTVRRRLYVVAGMVALIAGPLVPGLARSDAHTCAQVRVWRAGSATPIGSCHMTCTVPDEGVWADPTVNGTGAGATVCTDQLPV